MSDFDIDALYDALDEKRRAEGLSWTQAARAISDQFRNSAALPLSASTLTRMRGRRAVEGNGVLQMLRWLHRSAESFVPGRDAGQPLPEVPDDKILRFDTRSIYEALDERRAERGISWTAVASELGGTTASALTRLATGAHTSFPHIMRIAHWTGRPLVSFTFVSSR